MTILVKNFSEIDMPSRRLDAPAQSTGFGLVPAPAARQSQQLRRALMTMLLVLYPAMATSAVVIAALLFSGAAPII